jgi:primase-polymerase (primpol)-like protein
MDSIPAPLRALGWIGWRAERGEDGRDRKVPYQIGDPRRRASNSTPTHWRNEGDVREVQIMAPELFDGYGVVLTRATGITFIDLDDVRDPETGVIDQWALDVVKAFDSWAEISVSGTGVHVFAFGTLPGDGTGKTGDLDGDPAQKIEVYSQGRFAYLTGHALEPVRPLAERQRLITILAEHVFPPSASAPSTPGPATRRDEAPIPAGQRNNQLFRIARGFVLHGLRGQALEAALIAVSHRRCVPVPPDVDVLRIAWHAERLPDRRSAP